MKMKTLLLGSAAAFAFAAGSAQAADLSVAEPVDYVRVCDAFGTGYYYIPGTDTCLRIGGFVRFQTVYHDPEEVVDNANHVSNWQFRARAGVNFTAQSQTDWGPLVSYLEYEDNWSEGSDTSSTGAVEGWVALGPFQAGLYSSNFDTGGGLTSGFGLDDGYGDGTSITDNKLLQAQLAWAMNGFGFILALEDPSYRRADWFGSSNQGDMPNLVAAITAEMGSVAGKIAFLYADSNPDSTFGVSGTLEVSDLGGTKDKLLLAGAYIDNGNLGGSTWSALASFRHYWQSNLKSAVTVRYDDNSDIGGLESWSYAFTTDYSPVEDFNIRVGVRHYEADGSTDGLLEFRRDFGG